MKDIKLILVTCIIGLTSCSTFKHDLRKNERNTEKMITSILKENGNVFYLRSTYINYSAVWTYKGDIIEIYKLSSGNITEKVSFQSEGIEKYAIPEYQEIFLKIGDCEELDGDLFGFKIKRGLEFHEEEFSININCFAKKKYEIQFLNRISEDIYLYHLWNSKYN